MRSEKLVVIGGGGHVGLPLAIAFASKSVPTTIYDINQNAVDEINSGRLPFLEPDAEPKLRAALAEELIFATTDPNSISNCDVVVVVIGTPVDEHLNPDPNAIINSLAAVKNQLRDGQLLILRSTIFPGVTALVSTWIELQGLKLDIAFCPERIAEHKAMEELFSLPQIVAADTETARARSTALFSRLTSKIVNLSPEEAELAKLFTNTWRYIKFAAANEFYTIANSRGLDFEKIRSALSEDYPRAADLPRAGFAAGPCLFKDAMQLSAATDNNFRMGHAAMLVNEGLPLYLISRLNENFDLSKMTVGILGMAFKAGSDDIRSSLSYKLKRGLKFRALEVLCTDPYVDALTDNSLLDLNDVIDRADILIVATPHNEYRDIETVKPVVDIWNIQGRGVRV